MKIILFAGSLRKDSFNKKLIRLVHKWLDAKYDAQILDLQTLNLPVYDGDIETSQGLPEGVKILAEAIAQSDAVIISSPEYNGSISSPLKNTIDWVSRVRPAHPWSKKPILLIGASTGALSAMRGLTHSQAPLLNLGAFLYPNLFGLGQAESAFDSNDELINKNNEARLQKLVQDFLSFAKKQS